jgi:hypothetical protein
VVAVAAPDQRTPARRPVPVAADTPQAAAVSAVGQRRPDNGHGSASVVDIEHRGSRPVSRAGHCCSTADGPATTDMPRTPQRPRACRGIAAGMPEAARSAGLCLPTRPGWAQGRRTPGVRAGPHWTRIPDTLQSMEHPAQRTRATAATDTAAAVHRERSGPPALSAAIITGRQCPARPGRHRAAEGGRRISAAVPAPPDSRPSGYGTTPTNAPGIGRPN